MSYTIYWHKLDERAVIPSKRPEDSGFDIYTIEDEVTLLPSQKYLFKTGLCYSIDKNHWLLAYDRGSTGSKGIHTHCGICDQGYRGELFICLCNDNDFPVVFTSKVAKVEKKDNILYYPTTKAIAQLIPMKLEYGNCFYADDEMWDMLKENSERGAGKLGASGK